MCGICGIFNKNLQTVNLSILKQMNQVLYQRGPDDEGYFLDGYAGLAMRRLSIIDLASGHQPIHNEDQSVWVVLNGEIYNYQVLAERLKQSGHRFYSKSDTEVIVHLYEEYGEDCVQYLRGMFAFALWDQQEKKLIVARDRIGIKPLFYYEDGTCLLFASEIKSILKHPCPSKQLDMVALDQFLTMLYVPAPRSIYKKIFKLPPAHIMIVNNGKIRLKKYWELNYLVDNRKSLDEFSYEILEKFRETVKIHTISDVPIGTLLSGGIDSSAIVAVMSEFSEQPVETFNIGYENASAFDEKKYAMLVANRFSTRHHELMVKPDLVNEVREICTYFDEPFADASMIPNYYVSQLTRKNVTVALCGLGGDEVAAGYDRYLGLLISRYYQKIPRLVREKLLVSLVSRLPDSKSGLRLINRLKRFIRSGSLSINERYFSYISFLTLDEKNSLFSPDFCAQINGELADQYDAYFFQHENLSLLNRALFADLKMYLPDDLLTLSDRMSMYHSLELRVPFMDHEFVELMATVPPRYKLNRFSKKYILKKAFQAILPREILCRKKQGFSIPLVLWFRKELKSFVQEILSEEKVRRQGLFNYPRIAEMLEAHFAAKENYYLQIWALMNFMMWYKGNYSD
jgi:asparagine synthase (glutamine-hydrolysing)